MHTIKPKDIHRPEKEWGVVFVSPHGGYVIMELPNREDAMMWCSFLNGGMPPNGYHLDVTCHH